MPGIGAVHPDQRDAIAVILADHPHRAGRDQLHLHMLRDQFALEMPQHTGIARGGQAQQRDHLVIGISAERRGSQAFQPFPIVVSPEGLHRLQPDLRLGILGQ